MYKMSLQKCTFLFCNYAHFTLAKYIRKEYFLLPPEETVMLNLPFGDPKHIINTTEHAERNQMEINERLKALRLKKNYTLACVARRIGMSTQNYYHLEAGRKRFFVDELVAICRIFGKSPDYFLFGIDEDTPNHYYVRAFSELEQEDQIDVLNYIEYRRQLREDLSDPENSINQLYRNKS